MPNRRLYALAVLLGVAMAVVLYTVGSTRTKSAQQEPHKKEYITSVPEVRSCVKNIKVLNKWIQYSTASNTTASIENARVVVEVENTGELGVISISLETVHGGESYAEIPSSFAKYEPTIIIQPHGTASLEMPASNVFPDGFMQIGSVAYTDGTIEGCDEPAQMMRQSKAEGEKEKAKRKEKH